MKLKYIALTLVVALTLTFTSCSEAENTAVSETTAAETTAKYTDEELNVLAENMPEIVFVKAYYHEGEEDCTKGYYIKNDGTVNNFELENENIFDYRKIANQKFIMESRYEKIFDLSEVLKQCEKLEENTVSTEEKIVDAEDLKGYYKMLLNVDENAVMKNSFDVSAVLHPQYGFYGIRFNDDGEQEMLTLREYGGEWSISTDSNADKLYEHIKSEFPLIADEKDNIPIWAEWE